MINFDSVYVETCLDGIRTIPPGQSPPPLRQVRVRIIDRVGIVQGGIVLVPYYIWNRIHVIRFFFIYQETIFITLFIPFIDGEFIQLLVKYI